MKANSPSMNTDAIELKYQENIKPDSKWQFDQIDAYCDGQHLGYIRTAYISGQTIEDFKRDPLFLAYETLGEPHLYTKNYYRCNHTNTLRETHIPNYYAQARYVARFLHPNDLKTHTHEIESWNDEQLNEYVYKHRAQIFKKLLKNPRFKKHAEYHFCRPDIDYIHVFEPFQKKGVGTLLYRSASQWMNKKGMVLHSSTLQQDGAVRAWEKMRANGEADVFHLKGHKHPRYRYIKDVEPKWLSDKVILQPFKVVSAHTQAFSRMGLVS